MTRKTIEELESDLTSVQDALGLRGRGWQKTFMHVKSGGYYAVTGVALNEADLNTVVVYRPLRNPGVFFVRPFREFQDKFRPVVEPKNDA